MVKVCVICKKETTNDILVKVRDRTGKRNGFWQTVYDGNLCHKCLKQLLKSTDEKMLTKKESTTK